MLATYILYLPGELRPVLTRTIWSEPSRRDVIISARNKLESIQNIWPSLCEGGREEWEEEGERVKKG